jgi:hypothetical protein
MKYLGHKKFVHVQDSLRNNIYMQVTSVILRVTFFVAHILLIIYDHKHHFVPEHYTTNVQFPVFI